MACEKETLSCIGGRKYALILFGFLAACIAMTLKYATFVEWSGFVVTIFGLYFGVNYAQKKSENVTEVEINKVAGNANVARIEGIAEVNKIEAENDPTREK